MSVSTTPGASAMASVLSPRDNRLLAQIKNRRLQGERVVFTNGVFDLIHPGHLFLLEEAKSLGDILVVGLNRDLSVKVNKGDLRPLFPYHNRRELLLALRSVDYVLGFSDKTPLRLIRSLSPDILVKGGDYTPDQVVGRDWVEGHGGRLVLIPYRRGLSSTNLIERTLALTQRGS